VQAEGDRVVTDCSGNLVDKRFAGELDLRAGGSRRCAVRNGEAR
jgi:hypothetical protein